MTITDLSNQLKRLEKRVLALEEEEVPTHCCKWFDEHLMVFRFHPKMAVLDRMTPKGPLEKVGLALVKYCPNCGAWQGGEV